MPAGAKKRYNCWRAYEQKLSRRKSEIRYIREIIFGGRRRFRYYQISKRDVPDPSGDESWYIMTNLPGEIKLQVAPLYSLRNWIEYGFKQVKNELGWADFRLTNYASIERWWEIVFITYLLVSIQANYSHLETVKAKYSLSVKSPVVKVSCKFSSHPWLEPGVTWKSALNNLRLIIQPFIFSCLIQPWLQVFNIPEFKWCFHKLINIMNDFRASPIKQVLTQYPLSVLAS